MFRYTRTISIKNGAAAVPALQAAAELTRHVNKTYGFQMKLGTQLFGELKIHWYNDIESLDAMPKFAVQAALDRVYAELLDRIKPYVVEGSVRDEVVHLMP